MLASAFRTPAGLFRPAAILKSIAAGKAPGRRDDQLQPPPGKAPADMIQMRHHILFRNPDLSGNLPCVQFPL